MGYGLVKLPKLIVARRSLKIRLNWSYFSVEQYEEMKFKAMYKLEEAITVIEDFKKRLEGDGAKSYEFRRVKEVEDMIHKPLYNELQKRGKASKKKNKLQKKYMKREVVMKNIVKLNRMVKNRYYEYRMSCFNLEREIVCAVYIKDLMNSANARGSRNLDERWNKFYSKRMIFRTLPFLEIFWYKYVHYIANVIIFFVYAGCSTLLFFGEATIFYENEWMAKQLKYLVKGKNGLFYITLYSSALLSYMAVTCYFGVFYLKIGGFYGFWKRHTASKTLLNSALYASKMTFPMIYNFIIIFFKPNRKDLDFFTAMGNLDVVPVIGYDLPRYMPAVLTIVVLFNILNIYGKFMKFFGFSVFDFSENSEDYKVKNGKNAVERMKDGILYKLEKELRMELKRKNTESSLDESFISVGDDNNEEEYRLFDQLVTEKSTQWE